MTSKINAQINLDTYEQDKEILQPGELKVFSITGQYLTQLPDYLFVQKDQVIDLNISDNHLFKYPPQLCQFKNLVNLDLSSNFITSLSKEITKLNNLIVLNLSKNNISELPENFQSMKNLRSLNISKNKISWFSSDITSLLVTNLNIAQNSFTVLPSKFGQFSKQLEDFTLNWFKFIFPPQMRAQTNFNKSDLGSRFQDLFVSNKNGISFNQFVIKLSSNELSDDITQLFQAIDEEEEGIINDICQREQDFLTKVYKNQNPLIYAYKKSIKSFKTMIQYIHHEEPIITLVLFLSLSRSDLQIIEILIDIGVNLNSQWNDQLSKYSRQLNLLVKAEKGDSLVHVLFRKSCNSNSEYILQQKFAEILIQRGVDVNTKNCENLTPLHILVLIPQIKSLKWAINYDLIVKKTFNFNKKGGPLDWTLCHYTANLGYLKLLHELSHTEIDVFCRSRLNSLPKATCKSSLPVIKYLRKMERDQLDKHFLPNSDQGQFNGQIKINEFNRKISRSINKRQEDFIVSFEDDSVDLYSSLNQSIERIVNIETDQINIKVDESSFLRKSQCEQSIHNLITSITLNFQGIFDKESCDKFLNIIGQRCQPLQQSIFVMNLIHLIEFKLSCNVFFKCALMPTLLVHINKIKNKDQETKQSHFYSSLSVTAHEQIQKYQQLIAKMNVKGSKKLEEEISSNQNVQQLRNKFQRTVMYDLVNDWEQDEDLNHYHDILILTTSKFETKLPFLSSRTTLLQYEQEQSIRFKQKIIKGTEKQQTQFQYFQKAKLNSSFQRPNKNQNNSFFLNQTLGDPYSPIYSDLEPQFSNFESRDFPVLSKKRIFIDKPNQDQLLPSNQRITNQSMTIFERLKKKDNIEKKL